MLYYLVKPLYLSFLPFLASLCNRPLGMRNGRIRNHKITASSSYNRFHAAWLGRLGRVKTGRYIGAWCAKYKNYNQWFKVDFGRPIKTTKIATQGRQDVGHWITSYYVSFSADNIHWAMYRFRSVNKVRKIRKHNNWFLLSNQINWWSCIALLGLQKGSFAMITAPQPRRQKNKKILKCIALLGI